MSKKPLFEHTTCSRCAGSGTYSYCQMWGSTCFKCKGSGVVLTKRGAAAQAYLEALRVKPVSEVKVGDLVRFDLFTKRVFARVESIEPDQLNPGQGRINITARDKNGESIGFGTFSTDIVTMGFTAEEKQEQRNKALAYQSTLTKKGEPMKRSFAF